LLGVVTAALLFDVPDDPESVELQSARASLEPADIARSIMGVHDDHPLFESLVDAIRSAR
jgi:mannitol-1-phosphate 5-dehydrogenase